MIGREPELAVLEEFLGRDTPAPALLVTGGPGIGKTVLWEEGLRQSRERGIRVLAARASGAEAEMSFAGLFDLLADVDVGAVSGLPGPQRRALEVALLRAEPEAESAERFAVAAGFLSVLRSLTADQPLLIAVDDIQWLDAASAELLAFAARRAAGERFRFLLSRRSGSAAGLESELGAAKVHNVEVGPLSLAATRRLLSQRLGLRLPPRTLARVFDATQGNPLLALALGRELTEGRASPIDAELAGTELAIAELAGNPFGASVAKLPRPARRALLAAALSGHLSRAQLMTVADPVIVDDLVAGGLLVCDGELVRPAHPLLGAAARQQSRLDERRALHLALAQVAQDETLRARHLALSAAAPNAEVAGTVADAAAATARRGAAHDAAELAERALWLTPPAAAEYPRRLLAFAQRLLEVGELARVAELLGPAIGELPAGSTRARAHLLLGEARSLSEHEDHLELALADSADDPMLRATALAAKSRLLALVRVERTEEAEALAWQACGLARSAGGEVQRSALHALAWARVLRGRPVEDLSEQVPVLPGTSSLYAGSIDRPMGVRLAFRGNVREARALFRRQVALAVKRGEALFGAVLILHLCELELRTGDVREASRLLDQWAESGAMEGLEPAYARCQALSAALAGRLGEVEQWAAAVAEPAATGDPWDKWDELELLRARGLAALLAGEPERAVSALIAVWEHTLRAGVTDPGAFPVAADLVEALVWADRTAEANAVTAALHDLAVRQRHPWGLATTARCRAVVGLGCGYDEQAAARLEGAAASYGELGLDFDRARSLLWLGRQARRARKRKAARRLLTEASAEFGRLGSAGWRGQAQAELDLLGTGSAPPGALTPAEQRVAELAVAGLSNKDIARRLFVAVHTVEVHLTHAYAKLGICSRAQLAGHLAVAVSPPAKD